MTRYKIIMVVREQSLTQADGGFTSDILDEMLVEGCSCGCMRCIQNLALFSRRGNVEARRALRKIEEFF